MMTRRDFVALVGGAAAPPLVWPRVVRAQQRTPRRIGILSGFIDPRQYEMRVGSFKTQLGALGWIEGRNIEIDYRQSGNIDALSAAARGMVASKPEIILAMPAPAMQAIWQATRSIPVVFANVSDPVEGGFVVSLARPDGNVTGFTAFEYSLGGKWLELLKEIAPTTRRALVLFYNQYASHGLLRSIQESAPTLDIEITSAPVRNLVDIERAIEQFVRDGGGGLLTPPHPLITNNNRRIFELANIHRLPAVYPFRQYALDGGLVSYGSDEADAYRRAAGYVDRILNGEKPSNLPVQNPVKFQLVVNLKSARAIGLDIPSPFLLRADEVIE
jgi:putative ABC transport system substrate-binding protein